MPAGHADTWCRPASRAQVGRLWPGAADDPVRNRMISPSLLKALSVSPLRNRTCICVTLQRRNYFREA
jgi:hypothetical protein